MDFFNHPLITMVDEWMLMVLHRPNSWWNHQFPIPRAAEPNWAWHPQVRAQEGKTRQSKLLTSPERARSYGSAHTLSAPDLPSS